MAAQQPSPTAVEQGKGWQIWSYPTKQSSLDADSKQDATLNRHAQSQSDAFNFGALTNHLGGFEKVLTVLDDIRHLIGTNDSEIEIPKVVVIGDQSAGKSSLMELISGIDLPRAQQICTKVPCELRLRKCNAEQAQPCIIIACHLANQEKKETIAKHEIGDKIESYTEALLQEWLQELSIENKQQYELFIADRHSVVANKPIILTIYEHKLPNLTLVDLPGLIHSDKNPEKIKHIKAMAESYIQGDQSIIVNVLNCQNDAATAQSLQLSSTVDPTHKRTLLVLTKIDQFQDSGLQQRWQHIVDELQFAANHVFLVRNRTNKENEEKVSLETVQQNEMRVFEQRKDLSGIPVQCKGSQQLTNRLVHMQRTQIESALPTLRASVVAKTERLQAELDQFGNMPSTSRQCKKEFKQIARRIFKKLEILIKSKGELDCARKQKYICSQTMEMFESYKYEIREISTFSQFLSPVFRASIKEKNEKIKGFEAFPNEMHPSVMVEIHRDLVQQIVAPSMRLIDDVRDYILPEINAEIDATTQKFPKLNTKLKRTFADIQHRNYERTKDCVEILLEPELKSRPFTMNHYYMTTVNKMEQTLSEKKPSVSTEAAHPTIIHVTDSGDSGIDGQYDLRDKLYHAHVWYRHHGNAPFAICYGRSKWWIAEKCADGKYACRMNSAAAGDIQAVNPMFCRKWVVGNASKKCPAATVAVDTENADSTEFRFSNVSFDDDAKKNSEFAISEFSWNNSFETFQVSDSRKQCARTGTVTRMTLKCDETELYKLATSLVSNEDQMLLKQSIKFAAMWKVVCKRVIDQIPMQIYFRMVECLVTEKCQDEVFDMDEEINNDQWLKLMSVEDQIAFKIIQNTKQLESLRKAQEKLKEVEFL